MFHNGFYKELDILIQEDEESSFEFLANVFVEPEYYSSDKSKDFSAFEFLHGYCFDFAIKLSESYGYPIETVKLYNVDTKEYLQGLVHSYCTYIDNTGIKYYIDIRGITTNPEEFWWDFEDEITHIGDGEVAFMSFRNENIIAIQSEYKNSSEYFKKNKNDTVDFTKESEFFINNYKNYYDIQHFMNQHKITVAV